MHYIMAAAVVIAVCLLSYHLQGDSDGNERFVWGHKGASPTPDLGLWAQEQIDGASGLSAASQEASTFIGPSVGTTS
jgi:hypothetical protein